MIPNDPFYIGKSSKSPKKLKNGMNPGFKVCLGVSEEAQLIAIFKGIVSRISARKLLKEVLANGELAHIDNKLTVFANLDIQ